MPKNILIFSDGTGQRGGLFVDEARTNIYKLYRATRCGPESRNNPEEQLSFYDPGLGTFIKGSGFIGRAFRRIYNLASQATGLGISKNIVDCYTAIIQMWEPGDRIYLFGFSRGAYTVRCLAAVLSFCGVPTHMKDGSKLLRDEKTVRSIAEEAVTRVYQHVSSPRDEKYLDQRKALGRRFRKQYGSGCEKHSNGYPHFIGVFDTVASLGSYKTSLMLSFLALSLLSLLSFGLSLLPLLKLPFWIWFSVLSALSAFVFGYFYVKSHLKWAWNLEGFSFWETIHFTEPRMKFYDNQLNINVGFARHAISIDEHRADFKRVKWGNKKEWRRVGEGEPSWFKQLWFAGNHADIGGGYPENEARLSDTALSWMVDEAKAVPDGVSIEENFLQLFPSAAGMQHDETKTGIFQYAKKADRKPVKNATLHPSVFDRFELPEVLHFNVMKSYRPDELRDHDQLTQYYK